MMGTGRDSRSLQRLALGCLIGLLVAAGAAPASAHRTELSVAILSVQATLAPDGRSISFDIETRCDRKATIVEARVGVNQPQASGAASFTPTCNRIPTVVGVTVPASAGTFLTGTAQASALLVVRQGTTKQASDSASFRVRPSVAVRLADQAVLEGGGAAARIEVTVTCPMTATAQGGQVNIYQAQVAGGATFGPTPCDGLPHNLSVRVAAVGGLFQPGSAQAEAFASVTEGGDLFPGTDLRTVKLVG